MNKTLSLCAMMFTWAVSGWAQDPAFTGIFSELSLTSRLVGAASGRFNWDDSPDLVIVTEDRRLLCYAGRRDGTFAPPVVTRVAEAARPIGVPVYGVLHPIAVGQEIYASDNDCGYKLWTTLPIRIGGGGWFGGPLGPFNLVGTVPGTNQIQTFWGTTEGLFVPGKAATTGRNPVPADLNRAGLTDIVTQLDGGGSQVWLGDSKTGSASARPWRGRNGAIFSPLLISTTMGSPTFCLSKEALPSGWVTEGSQPFRSRTVGFRVLASRLR